MESLPANFPKTLLDAIVYFSDPDQAFNAAVALRWPNGITCPRCESKEHSFISTRKMWFCKGCQKQFTVKVGSIFEDSPLGMDKWMFATWLVSNCKNGVSSCEISRHLGITQKSAWFMEHRIRAAMQSGTFEKFTRHVEVDESFIGGKARNMHKDVRARKIRGRGPEGKAIVAAVLEKINTDNIAEQEGITEPIRGGGKAGLTYDTLPELKGVEHLDKLDDSHAVLLVRNDDKTLKLQAIALP